MFPREYGDARKRKITMKEITVKIYKISEDGYPDIENNKNLKGRIAFLWDGNIVSGWPVDKEEGSWETDDVGKAGLFYGVTHWVEFPVAIWDIERG